MELNSSYHQTRLWFIDSFEAGKLYEAGPVYHNIPLIIQLKGHLETLLLEKSIQAVINHHGALRTRIITKNSRPLQVIEAESVFELGILDLTGEKSEHTNTQAIDLAIDYVKQPFQLDGESLIRAKIIQLPGDESLLVIGIHHIISDRFSLEIISSEIFSCYQAFRNGKSPDLPQLPAHYHDFARWQLGLTDEALEPIIAYWKRILQGSLQPLEVPTDRPRAPIHIYHDGLRRFQLNGNLFEKLTKFCRLKNTGRDSVLLAAFKILLAKYSGQDEIIVGMSEKNRNQPELEHIVGPIANLLVLRSFIDKDADFLNVSKELEKTIRDARKYKDIPFELLDQVVKPPKDMSRTVFFDVLFQYQEKPGPDILPGNPDIKILETNLGYGKYDLNFLMHEEPGSISGIVVYNHDYYDDSTIQRFAAHYTRLLESCLRDPGEKISTLNFLTEQEQHQLLYRFNTTETGYPRKKNLHQLFEEQVEKFPHNISLIGPGHSKGPSSETPDRTLTYRGLNKKSNRLAAQLKEKGVGPDIIVALKTGRSVEMIIGILGVLKAGGAYLPIDPFYPDTHIEFMIKDSRAGVIVSDKLQITVVGGAGTPAFSTRTSTTQPFHVAYVIYTSGTTGRPKGSLIEHRNVVRLLVNDAFQFKFDATDTWSLFHSYCFDFSTWEMYGALLYGGKLVVIPRMTARDTRKYLEVLQQQGVTVLNQTPSAFYRLMEEELKQDEPRLRLKYVIFGGEALNPGLLREWKTRYPAVKLINMYGITETTVHVTYKEITQREIDLSFSNIGKPIPTLEAYVVDRQMNLVPIGVPGELLVGGEGVGRGYLNQPLLTEEKFISSPPFLEGKENRLYRSGDLVRLMDNGEMIYLGRIDSQVKIRGHRIEIGEIENRLIRFGPVKEAVVVDREDKNGDKHLCAYVVLNSSSTIQSSDLRTYLIKRLPEYMLPSYFVILASIPLTANGKVDRKALPDPAIEAGPDYVAPRDEIERGILYILSDVMGVDARNISVRANFFDIGINSVTLLKIAHRISGEFGINFPISTLFTCPTIEEVVEDMKKGYNPGNTGRTVLLNRGTASKNIFVISGDGAIYGFKELARLVEDRFNVYGIQGRGLMDTGELPATRGEIYEEFFSEIKSLQSKGPYILSGHCFGAHIAYETARLLEERKNKVEMVIHFDEPSLTHDFIWDKVHLLRLTRKYRKAVAWLKKGMKNAKMMLGKKEHMKVQNTGIKKTNTLPTDLEARRKELEDNYRVHLGTVAGHFTRIIKAPILIIKADEPAMADSPRWNLSSLAKQSKSSVKVVETGGNHFSMFEFPHVTTTALRMSENVGVNNQID
ncbi:MAG: amino acid adenylation domain-containing protein [bacterium]|nr:amino acid adenylation domain-containing protein [bacterium]